MLKSQRTKIKFEKLMEGHLMGIQTDVSVIDGKFEICDSEIGTP
jgi:hypothetical protein